jgi:hypothetical protein
MASNNIVKFYRPDPFSSSKKQLVTEGLNSITPSILNDLKAKSLIPPQADEFLKSVAKNIENSITSGTLENTLEKIKGSFKHPEFNLDLSGFIERGLKKFL